MELIPTKSFSESQRKFHLYCQNDLPTLILGEEGTGKTELITSSTFEKTKTLILDLEWIREKTEREKALRQIKKHATDSHTIVIENLHKSNTEFAWELRKESKASKAKWIYSSLSKIVEDSQKGEFSLEYFQEISVQSVSLKPIREMKTELVSIFTELVNRLCKKYKKKSKTFSPELGNFLLRHDYSGNWKELLAIAESLVLFSKTSVLDTKDIPSEILLVYSRTRDRKNQILPGLKMDDYEREIIRVNLELYQGNREKTAKSLGISERNLYRKIRDYNLP